MNEKTLAKILKLAEDNLVIYRNLPKNSTIKLSSAELCYADALNCRDTGKLDCASKRAIKSLAYSVGVFHADYKQAVILAVKDEFPPSNPEYRNK